MQARYRQEYPGEFVVLRTTWSAGKKQQEREWIDNPIENQHLSHRAACIGTNSDLARLDHTRLQTHRGGLLGSKKLQTYGTGDIALTMRLDFAVELDNEKLQQLKALQYTEHNIVYTNTKLCIANPGSCYLIPYTPNLQTEVVPIYLAAFDGHHEIFLIGYNNDSSIASTGWISQVATIMTAYSGTKFFVVGTKSNIPPSWFDCPNVEHMDYRKFITYCDV
jgi:hypothetical protein